MSKPKVKPLPCPLCGKEPEKPERLYASWAIACERRNHDVRAFGLTAADAVAEWNKRAAS